jgi:tRNA A-37 threonylcarbamoyl transferase component Bud32
MSGLEKVLKNPYKFKVGKKYKATNKVFPIEYDGRNYVVKLSSLKALFSNLYYCFIDSFFFQTRLCTTSTKMIAEEAEKLKKLDGKCAPYLVAHEKGVLVREYVYGVNFRDMNIGRQRSVLESLIETVKDIHERGVIIGDAHVKNYNHPYKWIDFDGVFRSLGDHDDKALDLLKLIYSTYTAASTSSVDERETLTYLMAYDIKRYYKDEGILRTLGYMMEPAKPLWQMWVTTRIPRDGVMLKELRRMFK